MYSLAMVTKAGVPANKLFIGVSSYGRSFKMANPSCTGPTCTFLGARNQSPAQAGTCTGTSGYISDAEIRQIIKIQDSGWSDATYVSTYDEESDSDIFIYDGTEWVAWMDKLTKQRRTDLYKSLGFAGTSDWAVDLQADFGLDGDDGSSEKLDALDLSVKCDLDKTYDSLDALDGDASDMYPPCLAIQSIRVLRSMLSSSFDGYDSAAEGYDGLFPTYEKYLKDTMNERLKDWLWKEDGHKQYRCYADPGTIHARRENAKEVACDNLPGENGDDYSYWFEVRDRGKWNETLAEAGFDPEWVEEADFEETDGIDNCPNPDAWGGCITTNTKFYHYPRRKDNIEIPNPKEIVDLARGNLSNINDQYDVMLIDIGLGSWDGSLQDAVEVLSVPVFMLRDAIDSMNEVKELAKKVEEENKKNLILKIVEGILFLIPFAGAAIGQLGRAGAQIARFLMAMEGAGSAGLGIYSMIEDPSMAPVAILGMLLGAAGGTPARGAAYRKLGTTKRDMTDKMKENMGKSFKELNPKVESITGKMCGKGK